MRDQKEAWKKFPKSYWIARHVCAHYRMLWRAGRFDKAKDYQHKYPEILTTAQVIYERAACQQPQKARGRRGTLPAPGAGGVPTDGPANTRTDSPPLTKNGLQSGFDSIAAVVSETNGSMSANAVEAEVWVAKRPGHWDNLVVPVVREGDPEGTMEAEVVGVVQNRMMRTVLLETGRMGRLWVTMRSPPMLRWRVAVCPNADTPGDWRLVGEYAFRSGERFA